MPGRLPSSLFPSSARFASPGRSCAPAATAASGGIMRTDLSPIAQHLILLFSAHAGHLTAAEVRRQLPDADEMEFYRELQMLVRTGIVRRDFETATSELVYWFADKHRPNGVTDPAGIA